MKTKSTLRPLRPLLAIAASSLLAVSHSHAVDYTWGGGTGNWNTANWNPGPVSGPTLASDTATINSGTVSLNVSGMNAGSLTLGAGAIFNAFNFNGVSTYTTYNNLILQGGTINGSGNYQNWGAGILKTVTVSGSSASTISASSFFNLNGTGANSSVFDVADVTGNTNADLTVSARLADISTGNGWTPAALVKNGGGTMQLSGANTYLGNTTVNSGTLAITSTGRLYGSVYVNIPIVTVNSGATLQVAAWAYGALGSVGPLDFGAARMVINGGTITYTGTGDGSARLFTIGTGGATLNAAGTGTWLLERSDTYGNQNIGNGLTLTLSGSANGQFSNVLAGSGGALAKSGAGTWTLSGANTYTGETTIKAGTLKLNAANTIGSSAKITVGDAGSSSTVLDVTTAGLTLGSTQTLAGIGSVTGTGQTVTINGTHAVGNAGTLGGVGTQTVTANTLAYGAGSIFEWDINTATATYDKVALTGARTVDSAAIFKVVSSTAFSDGFWNTTRNWTDIFGASSFGFDVANFQFVANGSSVTAASFASEGNFSITGSGTTLTWTAIPEPSTALGGLLLTAGLLGRRRKVEV